MIIEMKHIYKISLQRDEDKDFAFGFFQLSNLSASQYISLNVLRIWYDTIMMEKWLDRYYILFYFYIICFMYIDEMKTFERLKVFKSVFYPKNKLPRKCLICRELESMIGKLVHQDYVCIVISLTVMCELSANGAVITVLYLRTFYYKC